MTTLALVGIVLNVVAMVATCSDRQMRRMSRSLHCVFFAAENLFLAGFVGFLQLRGHERRLRHDKEHDLEVRCPVPVGYYFVFRIRYVIEMQPQTVKMLNAVSI